MRVLTVVLTDEEEAIIDAAARHKGTSPEEYAHSLLVTAEAGPTVGAEQDTCDVSADSTIKAEKSIWERLGEFAASVPKDIPHSLPDLAKNLHHDLYGCRKADYASRA